MGFFYQIAFKLRRVLGENLRLGEPDPSFSSLSFHTEKRVGERRPFGTPLSGSLPARASRGEREEGRPSGRFTSRTFRGLIEFGDVTRTATRGSGVNAALRSLA